MNYRHQFHAGNFADVVKHTVILALLRGLQRKEKGLLFLDTHAGRGVYDLAAAQQGDSQPRTPEWPDGIGRLETTTAAEQPAVVRDYLAALAQFRAERTPSVAGAAIHPVAASAARLYPGSPWLIARQLRPQDRLVLCERHPEEHAVLAAEFEGVPRSRIENTDGYAAIRAHLPPRERRALVLIDPPYEQMDEFAQVTDGLREGLRRLPGATFAVWFPVTDRAAPTDFLQGLDALRLPPTCLVELTVVGPEHPSKLKGCGVLVVNPPWQVDQALGPAIPWLATTLRRAPGGEGALRWIVPE